MRRDYMEESDVIQLLRYYRHDIMNQLQLIHGYISMDKLEMVKEKMQTYNVYLNEEQKLMNLNVPSFTLWLLFFNAKHANMRITYEIKIGEFQLTDVDVILTEQHEKLFHYLHEYLPEAEYYVGHIVLKKEDDDSLLKTSLYLNGDFSYIDFNQEGQLHGISQFQVEKTKTGIQGELLLPLHNEVD